MDEWKPKGKTTKRMGGRLDKASHWTEKEDTEKDEINETHKPNKTAATTCLKPEFTGLLK